MAKRKRKAIDIPARFTPCAQTLRWCAAFLRFEAERDSDQAALLSAIGDADEANEFAMYAAAEESAADAFDVRAEMIEEAQP